MRETAEGERMKIKDFSILEVRILKHLYCQNPHRNYNDPALRFKYDNGLEPTSTRGMMLRLFLSGAKKGSDLRQRLNPSVCLPGGTYGFIYSQLKNPHLQEDTRTAMPESFKRSYYDTLRTLIAKGLVEGYIAGYVIAEGEDGFRAPVPARWQESDGEVSQTVNVNLTEAGFEAARNIFLQLAEEGD